MLIIFFIFYIAELENELTLVSKQLNSLMDKSKNKIDITGTEATSLSEVIELQKHKIGEIITLNNVNSGKPTCSFVIHSIDNLTEYDKYSAPSFNMRFITMDVEIKNLSSEIQNYNALNFIVGDDKSSRYDGVKFIKKPIMKSGDIESGETVRGWVTIEVPEDATIIEILASACYLEPPIIISVKGLTANTQTTQPETTARQGLTANTQTTQPETTARPRTLREYLEAKKSKVITKGNITD